MESDILSGQQTAWTLIQKLGEGDAGEVYRVESLLGGQTAILKRPHRSSFVGDILRQSAQIRVEGKVLAALRALLVSRPVDGISVPQVLDQSKPANDYTGGLFIVIEEARGMDLGLLMRASRFGLEDLRGASATLEVGEVRFLEVISTQGRIPERVLLLALTTLFDLLEQIHSFTYQIDNVEYSGLIWNDVKPDHIFWNPRRDTFTIIDWGNCQLLEADGTSKDRRYSRLDDYRQLFEEMGRYLSNASPELYARLEWPDLFTPGAFSEDTLAQLTGRVRSALAYENGQLEQAREHEAALLEAGADSAAALQELSDVHTLILAHGAVPDYPGAQRFAAGLAVRLAQDAARLPELAPLCEWAVHLPGIEEDAWNLVARLAPLAASAPEHSRGLYLEALQAAICADGEAVLWNLALALQQSAEPPWWYDLTGEIRRMVLDVEGEGLRPLVAANRFLLGLQATVRQMENLAGSSIPVPEAKGATGSGLLRSASRWLKEDILPAWTQIEPAPPHSGLAYSDLQELIDTLADFDSPDLHTVRLVLAQPQAQVRLALDAWEENDFAAVRKALRRLLVCDPERRRVLRADQALERAPLWLRQVRQGPERDTNLLGFVTDLEFAGRELRNQVGPAGWLDRTLEGLRLLRRGMWPADLLAQRPDLMNDLPWLTLYERAEKVNQFAAHTEPQTPAPPLEPQNRIKGMKQVALGPGQEVALMEPLDAWAPEARGSSARVYLGCLRQPDGTPLEAAIKLMRMDKADYSLPLFREEVLVLNAMKDVPGVNRLIECGFLQLDGQALPSDEDQRAIQAMNGAAVRIGPDAGQIFLNLLEARTEEGWTPYVAIELRRQTDNLMALCDAGHTNGQYLPVSDLAQMVIQICDILHAAHQRNIVYRDHKILHYYWQEDTRGIYMIDWNVARLHPQGLSEVERHMDLVQFGARGLHHILTGRAAPGALPLGPTRPEEIEAAASQSYKAQWTYDDQRLSEGLREVIERTLAGEYSTALELRDDLKKAFMRLSK